MTRNRGAVDPFLGCACTLAPPSPLPAKRGFSKRRHQQKRDKTKNDNFIAAFYCSRQPKLFARSVALFASVECKTMDLWWNTLAVRGTTHYGVPTHNCSSTTMHDTRVASPLGAHFVSLSRKNTTKVGHVRYPVGIGAAQ